MNLDLIKDNLIRFAIRAFGNLIRLSVFASLCGIFVMMLLFLLLLLVGGGGNAPEDSWAAPIFKALLYILTDGTGDLDYSGDAQGLGFIVLSFFMPYLIAIDIVGSVIEQFTGRDIFRRLAPSLPHSLLIFLILYLSFFIASLFGNTSSQELPYIYRFFMFAVCYFLTAIYLIFVYLIGAVVDALVTRSQMQKNKPGLK